MYRKTISELENQGYSLVRVKNTWNNPFSVYKGVNIILRSPDGQNFELQFHTPESFDMKQNRMHELYEEARRVSTPESRRNELMTLMMEMSKSLEKPVDVENIR